VHWIQARKAFEPGSGAYPARIVAHDDAAFVVERLADRAIIVLLVGRPAALAAALARDDLTRRDGLPLALVHEGFGVLALATGPANAPSRITIGSTVARLEDGEAVEIPAVDDSQPSWQLFAARLANRA
jgi:hypothetical protein